jgi:hypothetical protein
MYQLLYGRDPDDAELRAGLDFLAAEPLRSYQERSQKKDDKPAAPKPETASIPSAKSDDMKGMGMMAGVVNGAPRKPEEKMLPVTPWGRYAKVLLSSAEFIFVD